MLCSGLTAVRAAAAPSTQHRGHPCDIAREVHERKGERRRILELPPRAHAGDRPLRRERQKKHDADADEAEGPSP